ncbi:hypothetical protein GGH12_002324 [Coemansia sp. RSA 1822]|nr:hypothetical protein LPJ76_000306 [Coemansia sp. RSA 638]KAJ2544557.1 hypothetical protein GGF49_001181 [Coemansia sp. RSA 1853]KAJ2563920.1 hypothetical protein GGH12_002324 [Coemansia sp. RSA 1822]
MDRLDDISRKLSQLALHNLDDKDTPKRDTLAPKNKKHTDSEDGTLSDDSEKTHVGPSYRIVEPKEKEMCSVLFSPLSNIPNREELSTILLQKPEIKIPIHLSTYSWLQTYIDDDKLEDMFDIVEKVGNICPKLTPRVETALQVNVFNDVTEGMQQCFIDVFLMGIVGTAQEYLEMDTKINRNANELSMTKSKCRPDYLLMLNGQLVFKGEEKKAGDVRRIALELVDKMIPGSVGKDGKLDYLLGYATAGSRVLFECIYADRKMSECSDILNLERVADRVSLLIIMINVVRVACTLYKAKSQ